ncbi:hypothetical protein ACIBG7_30310 [Nonomuraea sp. NPDC050328]|uniref:hypothetical protein n=1 Tax=Nonomuraea sp. NPDC050328 TaxID=3364361 RepID=UPI003788DD2C
MLWGLSFQRHHGSLVLLDRRFVDPNPFDAEPGRPIALIPADLTRLTAAAARRLAVPRPRSEGTVRWHTWGLDQAVHEWRTGRADGSRWRTWRPAPDVRHAAVEPVGGLLTFRASASLLRCWAVYVATMGDYVHDGMSYTELDGPRWGPCRSDGEVQTFTDYRQRVSVAKVSRREVLATGHLPGGPAEIRPLVWRRNSVVRRRRIRASA